MFGVACMLIWCLLFVFFSLWVRIAFSCAVCCLIVCVVLLLFCFGGLLLFVIWLLVLVDALVLL